MMLVWQGPPRSIEPPDPDRERARGFIAYGFIAVVFCVVVWRVFISALEAWAR